VRVGLLDLDTDGRLRYASTAASGLLIRHFGEATPLPWRVVAWWRRGAVEPLAFQSSDCRLVLHRSDDGVTVLIEEERLPPAVARFGLTPRETEILLRAARHASNDEIAHELGLSSRTVAKHLQNAYAKMAVSGRREAASRLGIRG
jgi:DNA-binding CsgD family transcriptional regulator